ncbi:MAG: sugar ABC transporter permease [Syntrophomonadaceae bacterium]|nr:sugar ABC transporter permease [Syntrophomonadaceae bacterium]
MEKGIKKWERFIYLLPAITIMTIVVLYPLLNALYVSFHQWDLATGGKMFFIGWQNYRDTIKDVYFWSGIGRALLFVLMVVPVELVLGTVIAILLNIDIKGQRFFRLIFIVPMMITPIVVALLWRIIYDAQFGILNWLLSLFDIPAQVWLGNPQLAMFSVAMLDIWQNTPFIILLVLAGLQAIPHEVYQAAMVDGAGRWQSFRFITLPYLKNTLLLGAIFRVVDSFRIFDTIFGLTRGGPGRATEVISIYTYKTGFSLFKLGLSACQSFLLLLITLVVTIPLVVSILRSLNARKAVS